MLIAQFLEMDAIKSYHEMNCQFDTDACFPPADCREEGWPTAAPS